MYKLFEFAVEWIPAIRNKAELSSVQKIACITAMADKKTCLYFQGFWGSKLFNGCLVVWPNDLCLWRKQ